MLKFNEAFCGDAQVNRALGAHITNRIIRIMDEEMDEFFASGRMTEDSKAFADAVYGYFPSRYPRKKVARAYLELYALLMNPAELRPKPLLEYALKMILRTECDRLRLCLRSPIESVPDRDRMKEALTKELYSTHRLSGKRTTQRRAEEILKQVEDFDKYEEICSWSEDYGLLDYFIDPEKEYKTYAERYEKEFNEAILSDNAPVYMNS